MFEHISASSSSWYQTLITALIIVCIVEQTSFWSLCLIIAHRFFNWFISEFPGHSSAVNPLSSKNLRIFREVWHWERSCWNMPSPSGKSLCVVGSKWVFRTALYVRLRDIMSTDKMLTRQFVNRQIVDFFLMGDSTPHTGYLPTKDMQIPPLPLCFAPVLIKDLQCAELNEKSIFRSLFFELS